MASRLSCVLVVVLFSTLICAGCEPDSDLPSDVVWERDFMTDGEAVRDSDWYFDGGNTGEYSQGFYMNQTDIAAPYLFTGDFEAEFEFYLKVLSGEDIYRYAIRLVDPNWENSTTRKYYSFAAYYTAFPEHVDAYYQVSQGNGSYSYSDIDGNVPGMVNGVNTCTLVRSGNIIALYMNDTLYTVDHDRCEQCSFRGLRTVHTWT